MLQHGLKSQRLTEYNYIDLYIKHTENFVQPDCETNSVCVVFYVPLKNISLIWRRHHYRWRAAKFRPMLGAQGLWAGRDLYRATHAVTRGLGFSGLIGRTAPFSRLLRNTRGCGGSILTRILTGIQVRKSSNVDVWGSSISMMKIPLKNNIHKAKSHK